MACTSVALPDPRREPLSRLVMQTFSYTLAIEHVGSSLSGTTRLTATGQETDPKRTLAQGVPSITLGFHRISGWKRPHLDKDERNIVRRHRDKLE